LHVGKANASRTDRAAGGRGLGPPWTRA